MKFSQKFFVNLNKFNRNWFLGITINYFVTFDTLLHMALN